MPGVQHIGPDAFAFFGIGVFIADQVHRHVILKQGDIGVRPGLVLKGALDGLAGGVGSVNHPAEGMAAFLGQMIFLFHKGIAAVDFFPGGEMHALLREPVNGGGATLYHKGYGVPVAQSRPGIHGVFDVGFHGIAVMQDGGDSPLRPAGAA